MSDEMAWLIMAFLVAGGPQEHCPPVKLIAKLQRDKTTPGKPAPSWILFEELQEMHVADRERITPGVP
jgi:hypothetical protein